jgi:hypothetical protein
MPLHVSTEPNPMARLRPPPVSPGKIVFFCGIYLYTGVKRSRYTARVVVTQESVLFARSFLSFYSG